MEFFVAHFIDLSFAYVVIAFGAVAAYVIKINW